MKQRVDNRTPRILELTYKDLQKPLCTIDAAIKLAGLPMTTPRKEARKFGQVKRLQRQVQLACKIYENPTYPESYRIEYGIPSAWDGGTRVIESRQVDWWAKRKYTQVKRSRAAARALVDVVAEW